MCESSSEAFEQDQENGPRAFEHPEGVGAAKLLSTMCVRVVTNTIHVYMYIYIYIYVYIYIYIHIYTFEALFEAAGVAVIPREREIFIDNLLVRVHLIIKMSRPALRHGSVNFLFQVALHLPS